MYFFALFGGFVFFVILHKKKKKKSSILHKNSRLKYAESENTRFVQTLDGDSPSPKKHKKNKPKHFLPEVRLCN